MKMLNSFLFSRGTNAAVWCATTAVLCIEGAFPADPPLLAAEPYPASGLTGFEWLETLVCRARCKQQCLGAGSPGRATPRDTTSGCSRSPRTTFISGYLWLRLILSGSTAH